MASSVGRLGRSAIPIVRQPIFRQEVLFPAGPLGRRGGRGVAEGLHVDRPACASGEVSPGQGNAMRQEECAAAVWNCIAHLSRRPQGRAGTPPSCGTSVNPRLCSLQRVQSSRASACEAARKQSRIHGLDTLRARWRVTIRMKRQGERGWRLATPSRPVQPPSIGADSGQDIGAREADLQPFMYMCDTARPVPPLPIPPTGKQDAAVERSCLGHIHIRPIHTSPRLPHSSPLSLTGLAQRPNQSSSS